MKATVKNDVVVVENDGKPGNGLIYVPFHYEFQWLWAITDNGFMHKGKFIEGLSNWNLEAHKIWIRFNESKELKKSSIDTIPSSILGGSEDIEITTTHRELTGVESKALVLKPGELDLVRDWYRNTYGEYIFGKAHVQKLIVKRIGGGPRVTFKRLKVLSGKGSQGVKGLRLYSIDGCEQEELFTMKQKYIYMSSGTLHKKSICKLKLKPVRRAGPACEEVM